MRMAIEKSAKGGVESFKIAKNEQFIRFLCFFTF
jgi:hypothetical protein